MTNWATVAIGKAIVSDKDGFVCKPDSLWRKKRGLSWDTCWCCGGYIPYPCNPGCRGWEQYGDECWKPCKDHEDGSYTHYDGFLRCFRPCDRSGQMYGRVGCGLGFDRVCVQGDWDCALRWAERVVDVASVILNVFPGVGTAIKNAAQAVDKSLDGISAIAPGIKKAAKMAEAIFDIRNELRDAAKAVKEKYKGAKEMLDAFSDIKKKYEEFGDERKECIMEEAALRFLTSTVTSWKEKLADDIKDKFSEYALDIAEFVDPTGLVSLGSNFVPPEDCDSLAWCTVDYCPGLSSDTRQPQGDPYHYKKGSYQYVGNGFCLNSNGVRMTHSPKEWQTTPVQDDGSAALCEAKCINDENCVGYMSEDGIKCAIIPKSNTCYSGTTMYVDKQKRNHCWKKEKGASTETPTEGNCVKFLPLTLRGTSGIIQLSEIDFFDGNNDTLDVKSIRNPSGQNPNGEEPSKAVDSNLNTKWLDFNAQSLIICFAEYVNIHYYRWATANDAIERDPVQWVLLNWTFPSTPIYLHGYNTVKFNPSEERNKYTEMFRINPADEYVWEGTWYNFVGNGWCLDANHNRINLPGISWTQTSVREDGSASACEQLCSTNSKCIGYLTEDQSKCDIMEESDANAASGIKSIDSETRVFCWEKKITT